MIFTKLIGNKGEDRAVREYRKRGYKIIARNFACRFGELDIVAQKGEIIVIAEVKTRKNDNFAEAKEFARFILRSWDKFHSLRCVSTFP